MYLLKDLIAAILARVNVLAAGEKFYNDKGDLVALQTFSYRETQPTVNNYDQYTNFPFVVARPGIGAEKIQDGMIDIRLVCGITTPSDYLSGEEDLDRLLGILLQLPYNQVFNPYSLESISYRPGQYSRNPYEEGRQPHPKYYLTMDLSFIRPAVFIEE